MAAPPASVAAVPAHGQNVAASSHTWWRSGLAAFGLTALLLSAAGQLATMIGGGAVLLIVSVAAWAAAGVIAFSPWLGAVDRTTRRILPIVSIPVALSLMVHADASAPHMAVIHLLAFFLASFACDRALVLARPADGAGMHTVAAAAGAALGLVVAVLAPRLFAHVSLYPLALVVAPAVRRERTRITDRSVWDLLVPAAVGISARAVVMAGLAAGVSASMSVALLALPALLCFSASRSSPRFAAALSLLLLGGGAFGADRDGPVLAAMWVIFGAFRLRLILDRSRGTPDRPERRSRDSAAMAPR